jgi:hypothetical protein
MQVEDPQGYEAKFNTQKDLLLLQLQTQHTAESLKLRYPEKLPDVHNLWCTTEVRVHGIRPMILWRQSFPRTVTLPLSLPHRAHTRFTACSPLASPLTSRWCRQESARWLPNTTRRRLGPGQECHD